MAETVLDTYTDLGKNYQDAFVIPPQLRTLKRIIQDLPPESTVLDVGCGTGRPACQMLTQAGFKVTGIDLTPKMIEAAKEQVPLATFQVADHRQWEPAEGSEALYNGIVCYYSFIQDVTKDDIRAFFNRASRWLKPGGLLSFGTLAGDGENETVKWIGRDVMWSGLGVEGTAKAAEDAGLKVLAIEEEKFTPKAAEFGLCNKEDVWEEDQLFLYCMKPQS